MPGLKEDGNPKIRPIDDLTASGINSSTAPQEKLKYDSLDTYLGVLREFHSKVPVSAGVHFALCQGHLWSVVCFLQGAMKSFKTDVRSAFRLVPVAEEHQQFAGILFLFEGRVYSAVHLAMMFGGIGSVHAWHRPACLIRAVARRVLRIPILCYVDDYYGAERAESAEHAMQCFARLLRACFGQGAAPASKMGCSNPLVVLGVSVLLSRDGVTFWPAPEKVSKWVAAIDGFLSQLKMDGGQASKLAGQLAWASQCAFRRLGRAMLRPINEQVRSKCHQVDASLKLALEWWREVLALSLRERRPWFESKEAQAQLFVDARSTPPHIAAVLFYDGDVYFCDQPAPAVFMEWLRPREDGQIMGLELLSVALGAESR